MTAHRLGSGPDHRVPWLLLFNCQADGLGRCLTLLTDRIALGVYDPERFVQRRDVLLPTLARFHKIIVAPNYIREFGLEFGDLTTVWRIPPLVFDGYHPDLCNLTVSGSPSHGPLGHYHSVLAYASFRCGLDEAATQTLFRSDIYERLGYFECWNASRDGMLDEYLRRGYDLRQAFAAWSGRGPFMHTINHPGIACLRDLAKAILRRAKLPIHDTDVLPHDNLANGPIFPVYPEIGRHLGVRGSYLFKAGGEYRFLDLPEFIAASFQVYRNSPELSSPVPGFAAALSRTVAVVETMR